MKNVTTRKETANIFTFMKTGKETGKLERRKESLLKPLYETFARVVSCLIVVASLDTFVYLIIEVEWLQFMDERKGEGGNTILCLINVPIIAPTYALFLCFFCSVIVIATEIR